MGGTGFLGGAIAGALAEAGHSVAVLSRGETGRAVPPGAEAIRADRHALGDALAGLRFEWVFDSCAYAPGAVAALLDAVGGGIGRYCLISSISAYGSFPRPGLDETEEVPDATEADLALAAALPPRDKSSAVAYGASYGPLKRACEVEAERILGDRATSLRVGLLVGAGDYTDRLTWWVRRIDRATGVRHRVPAPAPPDRPVQMIDARDAAAFAVLCAREGLGGLWNVTGAPMAFGDLLSAIADAAGTDPRPVWVPEDAITAAGLVPWTDVPLMAPGDPESRHLLEIDTRKARRAGLACRPLTETLGPLIAWDRTRRDVALTCGMAPEQEFALLRGGGA